MGQSPKVFDAFHERLIETNRSVFGWLSARALVASLRPVASPSHPGPTPGTRDGHPGPRCGLPFGCPRSLSPLPTCNFFTATVLFILYFYQFKFIDNFDLLKSNSCFKSKNLKIFFTYKNFLCSIIYDSLDNFLRKYMSLRSSYDDLTSILYPS